MCRSPWTSRSAISANEPMLPSLISSFHSLRRSSMGPRLRTLRSPALPGHCRIRGPSRSRGLGSRCSAPAIYAGPHVGHRVFRCRGLAPAYAWFSSGSVPLERPGQVRVSSARDGWPELETRAINRKTCCPDLQISRASLPPPIHHRNGIISTPLRRFQQTARHVFKFRRCEHPLSARQ
jgi:hypothetical protein